MTTSPVSGNSNHIKATSFKGRQHLTQTRKPSIGNPHSTALLAIASLFAACGRVGYDGRNANRDQDQGADSGPEVAGDCSVAQVEGGLGDVFLARVASDLTRTIVSSCAPTDSAEFAIELIANRSGTYEIAALADRGSAFIAMLDGNDCTAPEFICRETIATVELVLGESVVVVVEAPDLLGQESVTVSVSMLTFATQRHD